MLPEALVGLLLELESFIAEGLEAAEDFCPPSFTDISKTPRKNSLFLDFVDGEP
jgi:hypothetical protein